jgi:formylglycine-generating enzyme required for sulfatase activity
MRRRIFCILVISIIFIAFAAGLHATTRGITIKAKAVNGVTKELNIYSGYYALVVGCGDYKNGWPRLPRPVSDAREIAKTLKDLGYEVDIVEDPDWSHLRKSLYGLVTGPGKDKEKGILVWFSGHGYTLREADGTNLGYIVPVDAPDPGRNELGFMERSISMRQIETIAKRIASKHVLMVFDSCFSGAIFNMSRARPSAFIEEKVVEPVRQFITSGKEDEDVPDRSVFKDVFIQGIRDGYGDLNRDGYVTGEELGSYLQEKVINYSRKAQHPQYGKINNPKLDKGDFVFMLARGSTKGSLVVKSEPSNAKWYLDGTYVGTTPDEIKRLDEGRYTVEIRKKGYKDSIKTVTVRAGKAERIYVELAAVDTADILGMEFVYIPPGTFMMGSPSGERGRDDDETQHRVTVTKGFHMQTTKVTVGQWRAFAEDSGYRSEAEKGDGAYVWLDGKWEKKAGYYWDNPGFEQTDTHPVTCVSWNDTQAFITWLNEKGDKTYRLPTEAEWEYACRAGTKTARFWGDDPDDACKYANVTDLTEWNGKHWITKHNCNDEHWFPAPSVSFRSNPWGLYDMLGNVWEWCEDRCEWKGKVVTDTCRDGVIDPINSGGSFRVIRGGSWHSVPRSVRCAFRSSYHPDYRPGNLGFRLVNPVE